MNCSTTETVLFPDKHPSVVPTSLQLEQEAVTSHLHHLIRSRSQQKALRDRQQGKLLDDSDLFHETILTKLSGRFESSQLETFARCGHEQLYRTCRSCGEVHAFEYHCNIRWCPRCNWRITQTRQQVLAQWFKTIPQPKHVVTTQRNTRTFTRTEVRNNQLACARLRRTKVFEKVYGGCVSTEVTNEGRGWHLHNHWLLDARWVDSSELSITWGKLVGQDFAIVKVQDVRGSRQIQHELTKYCVKGSELATWHPEEILQFVTAIKGRRFFFVFGSLFKLQSRIRAQLNCDKPETVCDCGHSDFLWETELQSVLREVRQSR